ncbi:hypothetical protein [Streptomyces litchfieldiae]|uniref:Integral membrane protein n=1 Tax=Streptomyces litchfieldiae TaxID=3075543 RepID=A0ABU2MMP5_9ACTN|nr:hypothetical protein [Streptomyces sp. DSM 44938]MDT0342874.1 hypothetical protein [Streptomyces sp. DSM 44938]
MSQPWQNQPPQPGYGYPQQPGGYGYPQQPGGYGYPQQPGMGPPFPPPPPRPGSPGQPGLGIGLAIGAMVALLFLYGFLTGMVVDFESLMQDAMESGDFDIEVAQLTWLAAAVGALIGLPVGKLAPGQVPAYWIAGVLALAAMLLGETFATAVLMSEASDGAQGSFELFFEHFSDLWEGWTDGAEPVTWVLIGLAPVAAVFTGYLLGNGASAGRP